MVCFFLLLLFFILGMQFVIIYLVNFVSSASTILMGNITTGTLHVFLINISLSCNQGNPLSWSIPQRMANINEIKHGEINLWNGKTERKKVFAFAFKHSCFTLNFHTAFISSQGPELTQVLMLPTPPRSPKIFFVRS